MHRFSRILVAFSLVLMGMMATGCADNIAGPAEANIEGPRMLFSDEDWGCYGCVNLYVVNGSTGGTFFNFDLYTPCTWYQCVQNCAMGTNQCALLAPPLGGDPCSLETCGLGGDGGNAPNSPYVDLTFVPDSVIQDEDDLFDCRIVVCPTTKEIVENANVIAAAAEIYRRAARDSTEWGAWVLKGLTGAIFVGPLIQGLQDRIPGMAAPLAPPNAIASIHAHWRSANDPPSHGDSTLAVATNTNVVVVSSSWLYSMNTLGNASKKYPRR